MKKEKRVIWPIHKSGKNTGYEEYEDGSIEIAGYHYKAMDDAIIAEKALNDLLRILVQKCHELLIPIAHTKERFWKDVSEDYSLEINKYVYKYNQNTHIISRDDKNELPKEKATP